MHHLGQSSGAACCLVRNISTIRQCWGRLSRKRAEEGFPLPLNLQLMEAWLDTVRIITCILMVEWGLIHIMAGCITIPTGLKNDLASYFGGLYGGLSGVDPAAAEDLKSAKFWKYTNRALFQHGINLLWIGVWSCVFAGVNYWPEINRMAWALYCPICQRPPDYRLNGDTPHRTPPPSPAWRASLRPRLRPVCLTQTSSTGATSVPSIPRSSERSLARCRRISTAQPAS